MKIITNELRDMIDELAKSNPALRAEIYASNEKTFDFAVYKKNRYQEMLDECTSVLTEKLQDEFDEKGKDFDYKDFAGDLIPELISSRMPEQANIRFEMIQDSEFDHTTCVEYEMDKEDLSIHVRSFIDECMRNDLHDVVDGIWQDIVDNAEEEEEEDEEE